MSDLCFSMQEVFSKISYISGVNGVSHDLHPTLEGSDLEE